jgi:CRP-like cAMP-binding protein
MYEALIQYIRNHSITPLPEEAIETIQDLFVTKKIKRKQFFLQEGEICKYFAFITKGAMRQYFIDDKGVEHIIHLFIENWWVGDRESWVTLRPSLYNIDALEDTEALLITRAHVLKLISLFPAFEEMVRDMDERNTIATQKRLASSISCTAEKLYVDFINRHPAFLQRFPQHMIASYLGITKDTLSRVRKQALKK